MGSLISTVIESCPAKLNLFLDVHRRREDGFHELTTVYQTIEFGDSIEVSRAEHGDAEDIQCELLFGEGVTADPDVPADDRNLAVRAARLLRDAAGRSDPLRLRLTKRVPSGAGLGGGSADAAGALRGVRRLFGLDMPTGELEGLAAELGSDVPFLLAGGTALGRGRGEQLTVLPALPVRDVLLFVPDVPLSTPAVYGALQPDDFGQRDLAAVLDGLRDPSDARALEWSHNSLWAPATRVCPDLAQLRDDLESRLGSPVRLTGSGSTLFALLPPDDESPDEGPAPDALPLPPLPNADTPGLRAVIRTRFTPGGDAQDASW